MTNLPRNRQSLEDTVKEEAKKCKNAHFMMVDGLSKLMSEKVKRCQSSDFIVFGLKWNLLICSGVQKNSLSSYLVIANTKSFHSNWQVECSFKFSVLSQIGSDICTTHSQYFNAQNETRGIQYITDEDLKKMYYVNDKVIFCVEILKAIPNFPITTINRAIGTAERLILMQIPRDKSKFTWKITKFSSFNGTQHSSYEFTVGKRRWRLDMYPKGDSVGVGYLSLFLVATDYVTNSPIGITMAAYKLRVLDQLNRNHYETTQLEALFPNDPSDSRPTSWGQSKFLPLEELHRASRGLLVNDEIYIGIEFLYVSTTENL